MLATHSRSARRRGERDRLVIQEGQVSEEREGRLFRKDGTSLASTLGCVLRPPPSFSSLEMTLNTGHDWEAYVLETGFCTWPFSASAGYPMQEQRLCHSSNC